MVEKELTCEKEKLAKEFREASQGKERKAEIELWEGRNERLKLQET